jgi:hypothetical protein
MAALLYAGRRSLLTGAGRDAPPSPAPGPDLVDVLIPWERSGSAGRVGQPSLTAVRRAA